MTTSSVVCPAAVSSCGGKCGGEAVTATYGATSVSVEACSFLLDQGWTGVGLVLWHSQALAYLVPAAVAAPVVHSAGLVVLS
jgi:hypothetical protein